MIKRCKLTKRRYVDLDEFLMKADEYSYIVASMVDEDVRYVVTEDKFAAMRGCDAVVCTIDEIPDLASIFIDDIHQEILDVYADIKYLNGIGVLCFERKGLNEKLVTEEKYLHEQRERYYNSLK